MGLAEFLPVLFLALPAGQAADRMSRKPLADDLSGLAGRWRLWGWRSRPLGAGTGIPGVRLHGLAGRRPSGGNACSLVAAAAVGAAPGPDQCTYLEQQRLAIGGGGRAYPGGRLVLPDRSALCPYVVSACCSVVVMGLLVPIRFNAPPRRSEPLSLESFLRGMKFVLQNELILATITLDLFAVLLGGATALLPILRARDILARGAVRAGMVARGACDRGEPHGD